MAKMLWEARWCLSLSVRLWRAIPGNNHKGCAGKTASYLHRLFLYNVFGSTRTDALSPTTVVHSRTRHDLITPFCT